MEKYLVEVFFFVLSFETVKKHEEWLCFPKTFFEENDLKIDYVDVADTVSLKVGVDGRFDVELGTQNDIENKIKQLKTMVNEMQNGEKGLIRLYMWNTQKPDGTFVENYTK